MTNAQIAAFLQGQGIKTPAAYEPIVTQNTTLRRSPTYPPASPPSLCASGSPASDPAVETLAEAVCAAGAHTPQDMEEIGTIILTRGFRTDSLNY